MSKLIRKSFRQLALTAGARRTPASLCAETVLRCRHIRCFPNAANKVNPDISGVEYKQGTLAGYELREYLLQKWSRTCAYCKKRDIPLQIEHIVPKSRGGSDRVSNLTLACEPCNLKKNNRTAAEFGFPNIQRQALAPLKDAAAVNVTRYMIGDMLRIPGLPISFWSGGRTKFNRVQQGYAKAHWIDAACVGDSGSNVSLRPDMRVLQVKACGTGSRQMCRMDKFGFPRTSAKAARVVKGFRTGDIVRAVVPKGKGIGIHIGKVAVRTSGSFNVSTQSGVIQGISYKYCSMLHRADGYSYLKGAAIPLGNKLPGILAAYSHEKKRIPCNTKDDTLLSAEK